MLAHLGIPDHAATAQLAVWFRIPTIVTGKPARTPYYQLDL